jgi:hypothetical protein
VKWLLRGGLVFVVLAALQGVARAAPPAPKLTGSGTVDGDLISGTLLTVKLRVAHTQGWQHIQVIDVDLTLHDSVLDQLQITPTTTSLSILGGSSPGSLGQAAHLTGAYFDVNPAKVTLIAQGRQLRMTIPIRLRTVPPAGARLAFDASAVPVAQLGPKALTKPVGSNSGFSWATLGLAIAVALFAGGFFGNVFASRRRPARGPSIYASVQRRLEQEKEKAPTP